MRGLLMLFILIILAVFFAAFRNTKTDNFLPGKKTSPLSISATTTHYATSTRLKKHSPEAKSYLLKHHFNNRYCFFIDMKIASGNNRFFIYDLKKDTVLLSGLVTHGSGNNSSGGAIIFSNRTGSNCTSLGRYRIGKSYQGKFGLSYKLYGLDSGNNNAFKRFVVLHAHPCVPDAEVAPSNICQSWGCPTVSPLFLQAAKSFIDRSYLPVMMWIFN